MATHAIPAGRRIHDLRVGRGMTQEKLARMSNVDIKTIYRAEQGEAAMRPETLLDIATALDVSLDEICSPCRDEAPAAGWESEGHGNLLLRRIDRASSFHALAEGAEHYSWGFQVDPDEVTATAIREVMQIVRRATLGPKRITDRFDDEHGEFSEPARVARLKALLEQLRNTGVSVLANKFIHVDGQESAVVLRVLFVEGEVERRKEFASFELPREDGMNEMNATRSKVIEDVGGLDFATRGCSVMGALEMALHVIGEDTSYDDLMGGSGMAFRLQMRLPEWCPSAPYAAVGRDCVPHAAAAIGRPIDWIPAEPAAGQPMERRIRAITVSIDRGMPVLYGAEECALIVGYHRGGEKFSLRSYFDATEMYSVLDQLSWPSPGILGDRRPRPTREQTLTRSLALAVELAHCEERFPSHHPGRDYVCGFAAWEAWISGLRDEARFEGRTRGELAAPLQANSWCYLSLLDARAAAGRYLYGFEGDIKETLEIAEVYERMAAVLRDGRAVVPHPQPQAAAQPGDDSSSVAYRMKGSDTWSAEARHQQADTLESALALEREAIAAIESLLASD